MPWDLVVCLSGSVLETTPFLCLILPDLPTGCTPGLVGVVTGDGLVQALAMISSLPLPRQTGGAGVD